MARPRLTNVYDLDLFRVGRKTPWLGPATAGVRMTRFEVTIRARKDRLRQCRSPIVPFVPRRGDEPNVSFIFESPGKRRKVGAP